MQEAANMAVDLMTLIDREMQKLQRTSPTTSDTPWLDSISEGWAIGTQQAEQNRKDRLYKDAELDGQAHSLDELIGVINNAESLDMAEAQLQKYEEEGGDNAEHITRAMKLRETMGQKKKRITDYGTAMQDANELFNNGSLSLTQADFENLPATYQKLNKLREDTGLKPYSSIMDYMSSEVSRTNSLLNKIKPGISDTEESGVQNIYSHGYQLNNSDTAIYGQLSKHALNLDAAMKALYMDETITPEEAQAILVNPEFYEETKRKASSIAKSEYDKNNSAYRTLKRMEGEVKLGEFEFDEDDLDIFKDLKVGSPEEIKELKKQSRDQQLTTIAGMIKDTKEEMTYHDNKFFNWQGLRLAKVEEEPDDTPEKYQLRKGQGANIEGLGDEYFNIFETDSTDYVSQPETGAKKVNVTDTEIPDSTDYGIFQINDKYFADFNPSEMSEMDQIQLASKIVYGEVKDSDGNKVPTVYKGNNNDGWNNWTSYSQSTDEYKKAINQDDAWFLANGLTQEQLDSIDTNFKTDTDKRIARAVIYAESKGDHTAQNINKKSVEAEDTVQTEKEKPSIYAKQLAQVEAIDSTDYQGRGKELIDNLESVDEDIIYYNKEIAKLEDKQAKSKKRVEDITQEIKELKIAFPNPGKNHPEIWKKITQLRTEQKELKKKLNPVGRAYKRSDKRRLASLKNKLEESKENKKKSTASLAQIIKHGKTKA